MLNPSKNDSRLVFSILMVLIPIDPKLQSVPFMVYLVHLVEFDSGGLQIREVPISIAIIQFFGEQGLL
jgi:hypothetical protein